MRLCALLLASAAMAVACGTRPGGPSPLARELTPVAASAEWPASTAEGQGLDPARLRDLVGRIDRTDYGSVTSLLVVRHGQLVVEEYFSGWSSSRAHTLQSVTKSVTSLLAGIAIDRGRLATTDRVVDFFPDYAPIANLDDRKQAMTVRDLLTMRTGLDWGENPYAGSPLQRLNECRCDWLRLVLDWPMRDPAGTRWEYNSGGVITLGAVIGRAVGARLDLFAASELFGPLGMTGESWYAGLPDGLPHSGGGLDLRPRDMAKLGQLVLDRGVWRGRRLISEAWIQESTTVVVSNVRTLASRPADYGYLWWRMPQSVTTASGSRGQWIFIIPAADLVVVSTGASDADYASAPSFLYSHILPAVGS